MRIINSLFCRQTTGCIVSRVQWCQTISPLHWFWTTEYDIHSVGNKCFISFVTLDVIMTIKLSIQNTFSSRALLYQWATSLWHICINLGWLSKEGGWLVKRAVCHLLMTSSVSAIWLVALFNHTNCQNKVAERQRRATWRVGGRLMKKTTFRYFSNLDVMTERWPPGERALFIFRRCLNKMVHTWRGALFTLWGSQNKVAN